jgi:hypothetical protein
MIPTDSVELEMRRQRAVDTARAMLEGRRSVCDGCRNLKALACDLVPDWRVDPDFVVFGGVDSESDDFPLGDVRGRWDPDVLANLDAERERYEAKVRDTVLAACRSVVNRFGAA